MLTSFDKFINEILIKEGGYVNHPDDSGGETNFGITVEVARKHGYLGEMKRLTVDEAKSIYKLEYWLPLKLNIISSMSEQLALKIGDIGVNMGCKRAGYFLQRLLNVLNRKEKDYPDIEIDGVIGTGTLMALESFIAKRGLKGELVLMRGLNALQGSFYISLAERRHKDESFMFGWLLTRVQ